MSTEADIKNEIARLTATINQHKSSGNTSSGYGPTGRGRGGYRGGYYNSNYSHSAAPYHAPNARRMNNKYIRPGLEGSLPTASSSGLGATASSSAGITAAVAASGSGAAAAAAGKSDATAAEGKESSGNFRQGSLEGDTNNDGIGMPSIRTTPTSTTPPIVTSTTPFVDGKKEVVIGGVAFESSARSLVRKDLPKPKPSAVKPSSTSFPYTRKAGHLISTSRSYKPKTRRGRGRNLTLDNTRKSWSERLEMKKRKYLNKPCPRFTTTGVCTRGLTCMYQHDPSKIAICWNYLQDNCPNTAETCPLSHDPTPERTPLCLHFLNKGRCTRVGCLFPHVNVGKREGVCRDFAVLGYCEKGWDCDKQHVRECPDFAENGTCSTKGCKLPHVIRANRGRKVAVAAAPAVDQAKSMDVDVTADVDSSAKHNAATVYAEDGKLGDEFISLTFHESEDESSEEEEEDEEDDEDEESTAGTDSEGPST